MPDNEGSGKVVRKKNGDLVVKDGSDETLVAHFDSETGHLEFVTKAGSVKYYQPITDLIGSTDKGRLPSGVIIKSMSVKGDERPAGKLPPRPKLGPAGDSAREIVEYYLKHDLPQAVIRYGIYTDEAGKPIRKKVRRRMDTITDNRDVDDSDLEAMKDGPKTWTKGPVSLVREAEIVEDAIIARRATEITYMPSEVVGGFDPEGGDEQ